MRELPELPEPDLSHIKARDDYDEELSYSAEAMRQYAMQAVLEERERCAKLCDAISAQAKAGSRNYKDTFTAAAVGAGKCAASIREGV